MTLLSRLLQQKLVNYLKYGEFQRVGESNSTAVDVRVIATATQDVGEAVASHHFSSDLFYRLSVGHIHVLPLRERREEIPALMDYFLTVLSQRHSKPVPKVPLDKLRACVDYTWPGNVRELEMRLERWIALGNKEIAPESVPRPHTVSPATGEIMTLPPQGLDLEDYVDSIEKRLIQEALQRTGGTQTAAAMLLGLTFRQFRYKLQKFHLKSTGETPPMHPD